MSKRVSDMSVQEIKEAYATRFEGWAAEEDRLEGVRRMKAEKLECQITARAYRAVAAELRKIGGPV